MVAKKGWAHPPAHSLVPPASGQAARTGQLRPRQLSFAGAVQTLNALRWALLLGEPDRQADLVRAVLLAISSHRVGDRPGRCEPRKVKRRPKGYPRLMKPRAQERAELLEGAEA